MLSLAISYANGVAHSTDVYSADGTQAEWPPHPSRVFQAMVHTAGESNARDDATLEMFERLGPPELYASEARQRPAPEVYVPFVATKPIGKTSGMDILGFVPGFQRGKKPRRFPAAVPLDNTVELSWPEVTLEDDELRNLQSLCARVGRLGRSLCAIEISPRRTREPNLLPSPAGPSVLRVPYPGMLRYLRGRFKNSQRGEPQDREICRYVQWEASSVRTGEFRRMIPFKFSGSRSVPLTFVVDCTIAIRDAIKREICPDPPEWIHGHNSAYENGLSRESHLGFTPLVDVNDLLGAHSISGMGLLIPTTVSDEEVEHRLGGAIEKPFRVRFGDSRRRQGWADSVVLTLDEDSTDSAPWVRSSRAWATVTPLSLNVALDRCTAEQQIAQICRDAGFPEPEAVTFDYDSPFRGFPRVEDFGNVPHRKRPLQHVVIKWPGPITGPVSLGSMRYMGMGSMYPVDE